MVATKIYNAVNDFVVGRRHQRMVDITMSTKTIALSVTAMIAMTFDITMAE